MKGIPLHPERGLDPHLTYCPRCGGDANAVLIGALIRKRMPDGRVLIANECDGIAAAKEAGYTMQDFLNAEDMPIAKGEKIESPYMCESCEEEIRTHSSIVHDGGVFFKCKMCHQEGVIRKSEFAQAVRDEAGIQAPDPVGIEFDRCAEHGEPTEKKLVASSAEGE